MQSGFKPSRTQNSQHVFTDRTSTTSSTVPLLIQTDPCAEWTTKFENSHFLNQKYFL